MLPFGFVVLPIVATMLHTQPMVGLQLANEVGFLYGGVMPYLPQMYWLQTLIIFPAVATPRQLVIVLVKPLDLPIMVSCWG
jgi:hypothetical protein